MLPMHDIVAYALALSVAAAVPGPGITALVARTAGQGAAAGAAMTAGLILGDLTYLSVAVFGLSFIAAQVGSMFSIIRWAAAFYLLWLAWQFWNSQRNDMVAEPVNRRTLVAAGVSGLLITLSNPKTIAFYLALMPLVIDVNAVSFEVWGGVFVPVTIAVLVIVCGFYVTGANAMRIWLTTTNASSSFDDWKGIYPGLIYP